MEAEGGRAVAGVLRQRHLGEQLVGPPPCGAQALEHRAVTEAGGGQALVQVCHVDLGRTGRRPRGQVGRRFLSARDGREHAGGVPGPRFLRQCLLRARVHRERTAARLVHRAQRQTQLNAAMRGQDQRCLQRQLLQHGAADLVAGADRQFDEGGARQQDRAHDGVIGQPRLRLHRQPGREDQPVPVREFDARAEQRMSGGDEPERCGVPGRRTSLQPVPCALEGVGGQVDPTPAGTREDGCPVDGHPAHVGLGERGGQRADLRTLRPQHRHERGAVLGGTVLAHRGEYAVRTELHERADALALQRLDRVAEAHRLADMPHPVLGRGQVGRLVERRHDRDPRSLERQTRHDSPELVQHRVHQRRVEGMADRQPLGLATLRDQLLSHSQHRRLGTRKHHRHRTVDRRDPHLTGEQRQHLVLGRLHRHHHATRRQRLHQPTTRRHQLRRVRQRQHPRHMCGCDLTDRMPRQEVRPHSPRLDQAEQRHLKREQCRLRVAGLVDRLALGGEQQLAQWTVQVGVELRAHLVQRVREHRERAVEFGAHAGTLAALAGEQERRASLDHRTRDDVRRRLPGREREQSAQQFLSLPRHDHRASFQGRAARRRRVGDVERFGLAGDRKQALGLGLQRACVLRRQQHRQDRRRRRGLGDLLRGDLRSLLQDRVRVGPAHTEGRDTGPTRRTGLRPRHRLGQQLHRTRRPVDMRRRLVHVQRLRQHAVPHRHDHLDHTGHTRRRLRVTHVGLQRTQPQRPFAVLSVRRQQGLRLDRVAQSGARAMRLDGVHLVRRQTRVLQGLTDHALLRRTVRGRQTVARTVLVDGRAAHDRQHRVTVAAGVREPLDQQHADAFGPARAVRTGGEGLAPAVGGQTVLAAELDEHVRGREYRHTARQRHRALAVAQRLDGEVQRDQRRGAGGVHGDRGTLEAEGVGDAAGDHRGRVAGEQVALDALRHLVGHAGVAGRGGADEDAGAAAADRRRVDAGPLEHLPGGLQQQPLLRVHRQRLTRADAEEGRVELGGLGEEPAAAGVEGALAVGVLVVQVGQSPPAVGGELTDRVDAVGDQPPQRLR